jgi:hypothetical protein
MVKIKKFHFSQMHKMDASSHPPLKTTMYLNFIQEISPLGEKIKISLIYFDITLISYKNI